MTSYDQWKTTDPALEYLEGDRCPDCDGEHDHDAACDDEDDRDPLEVAEDRPLPTEDETGLVDVDI